MSAALPEGTGTCTNFTWKGFGFIDMGGITLFVHQSECESGKVPKVGDVLTFQYEPRRQNPEQFQAKNVKGCTGVSESAAWGAPFTGPVQGTGAHTGTVKSFGPKGYGFINMEDGKEMFFNVKDCVGSKPISGDTVRFDVVDSDTKPGQLKAANITGGSQPLDSPHPGTKPSWGPWGGMGPMGGMGGMGGMGPMGGAMAAMGGKGWGWDGGKGAMSAMWNWGGKGWGGDGWSKGMGKGYGPAAAAPVAPGPYSAGGCAKGGW